MPGLVAYPSGERFGASDRGRLGNRVGVSMCAWKTEGHGGVKNFPARVKFEIPVFALVPQNQILREEFEGNDLLRRRTKDTQVGRWGSEVEKRRQRTGYTSSR